MGFGAWGQSMRREGNSRRLSDFAAQVTKIMKPLRDGRKIEGKSMDEKTMDWLRELLVRYSYEDVYLAFRKSV